MVVMKNIIDRAPHSNISNFLLRVKWIVFMLVVGWKNRMMYFSSYFSFVRHGVEFMILHSFVDWAIHYQGSINSFVCGSILVLGINAMVNWSSHDLSFNISNRDFTIVVSTLLQIYWTLNTYWTPNSWIDNIVLIGCFNVLVYRSSHISRGLYSFIGRII